MQTFLKSHCFLILFAPIGALLSSDWRSCSDDVCSDDVLLYRVFFITILKLKYGKPRLGESTLT